MHRTSSRSQSLFRRDLRLICLDGVAFSVMVGLGETYLAAFAIALGLSEIAVGLIVTCPMLVGSIVQLAAPWGVSKLGSYRRWVVGSIGVQTASLIPLWVMAWYGRGPVWLLFVSASLYWAGGLTASPAWNAWVEHLVPRRIRPTFFAHRSRYCQVSTLIGLVTGGAILEYATPGVHAVHAFAGLFGVAFISRLSSLWALALQSEAPTWIALDKGTLYRGLQGLRRGSSPELGIRTEHFKKDLSAFWSGDAPRLVTYLVTVQAAVYVAAPYFTPFMLERLRLSYLNYMLLVATGFVGKSLALPWAALVAKRVGAGRLLWIGSLGIIPLSGLWVFHQSFLYLAVIQLLGGFLWACYELAMLLLFFERIPQHQRVDVLSFYNLTNTLAMVTGSVIGAALLAGIGGGNTAYLVVFLTSSLLRAAAIALFPTPRAIVSPIAERATTASAGSTGVAAVEPEPTVVPAHARWLEDAAAEPLTESRA